MRLQRLLSIKDTEAVGLLHFLWWWCLDNAPSGDLTGLDDRDIATAAHWRGDATRFVTSLTDAGWLEKDDDRLTVHDWQDYAGKLIDRRSANAARNRVYRDKASASRDSNERVTRQSRDVATVPNRTVPNSNKEIIKKDGHIPEWIKPETWQAFLEVRKKKRAPETERALSLIVKELERLNGQGQDPEAVLNQSIMRGYTGVFPVHDRTAGKTVNPLPVDGVRMEE